jgi:hypothetical protein
MSDSADRGDERPGTDVQIIYTPATLAGGFEPGEEIERIAADARASLDGGVKRKKRLSRAMLADLRASGWLRQARWRRGAYFTTYGLRRGLGVPDLVLLNVPSAFAPSAQTLLNRIADHIIEDPSRVYPGAVLIIDDPKFQMAVTVDLIEPGDMRLPDFDHQMMVVVPLP